MNSINKSAIANLAAQIKSFGEIEAVEETMNGFQVFAPEIAKPVATILDSELPESSFSPWDLMSHALTALGVSSEIMGKIKA